MPPARPDCLEIAAEVAAALAAGQAVVALESTLISHGLPAPDNIETAQAAAQAVRDAGAIPATVAVITGRLKVGLDAGDIDLLANGQDIAKLSRRDLGLALATGGTGATTVATTMMAARRAGIKVFATGGIGGVHRGASATFDISADLAELARTNVVVVCSGAKAILDLPKTREMLETLGVPVLGHRTDHLPGFWTTATDLPVDRRLDDVGELRAICAARDQLGDHGGILLVNPVPAAHAIAGDDVERWVGQALAAADAAGVTGKDLTPYLLDRVAQLSAGRTLAANKALITGNARLAGLAAVALAGQPT